MSDNPHYSFQVPGKEITLKKLQSRLRDKENETMDPEHMHLFKYTFNYFRVNKMAVALTGRTNIYLNYFLI